MGLRRLRYPVPRRRRRWGRRVVVGAATFAVLAGLVAIARTGPDASVSMESAPRPGSAGATPPDGTAPPDPATTGVGERTPTGGGAPPVARIQVGPTSLAGVPVAFSSEGSSDPEGGALTYRWSFGDRSFPPAIDPSPTHVFAQAGTYRVRLTVTDPTGATASTEAVVEQARPDGAVAIISPVVGVPGVGATTTIRVWFDGQRPRTAIIAKVCRRSIADPAFREGLDCSLASETVTNGTETGSGWLDVPVFRGSEPAGDGAWGCFAPGDPAPPGIEKLTTCYIRITNNLGANTRDDREVAFTLG